ncbi:MAG: DNA repair protein RecN [Planctomycetes bacterium]|nr:DNA repair protein RecN [Planctomycetota bacterium]
MPAGPPPISLVLRTLSVRGFALLEDVRVDFAPGLNVVTGETGAGKSLLVGALAFLLGEKADASRVREGAAEAFVEGVFELVGGDDSHRELLTILRERVGVEPDEGQLAVSRSLDRSGRSRAQVNHRFLTRETLRDVASCLVAIQGQREHSTLLKPAVQRDKLDAFLGLAAPGSVRARFMALRAEAAAAWREISELRRAERERLDRLDLLKFQSSEIRALELTSGETARLEEEYRVLTHVERIRGRLAQHLDSLVEAEGSAVERLASARRALEELAAIAPPLGPIAARLEEARLLVDDAAGEARRYVDSLDADPARLDAVSQRLDRIGRILDRFRVDEAGALDLLRGMEGEMEKLEGAAQACGELEGKVESWCREMESLGKEITQTRVKGAERLAREVQATLVRLGMEKSLFVVTVRPIEARPGETESDEPSALARSGPAGFDEVVLEIAPNPGEPLKPVSQIASGGELSRVALAVEAACAETASLPTVLFDEIDENVGGRLSSALGEQLRRTARGRQVLVITHLAGVAAHADRHLHVSKETAAGRTRTVVRALGEDERVAELAAMGGGDARRPTALADARALLESSRRESLTPARPQKRGENHTSAPVRKGAKERRR